MVEQMWRHRLIRRELLEDVNRLILVLPLYLPFSAWTKKKLQKVDETRLNLVDTWSILKSIFWHLTLVLTVSPVTALVTLLKIKWRKMVATKMKFLFFGQIIRFWRVSASLGFKTRFGLIFVWTFKSSSDVIQVSVWASLRLEIKPN